MLTAMTMVKLQLRECHQKWLAMWVTLNIAVLNIRVLSIQKAIDSDADKSPVFAAESVHCVQHLRSGLKIC